MEMVRTYIKLTKPGIIMGNAMTATCGYLVASSGSFELASYLGMILGLACIIAAACVANNCIDRAHDARMRRTQGRALVTGAISLKDAIIYCVSLGAAGIDLLAVYTNPFALTAALFAVFIYLALYSTIKYRSPVGTLIGSVAGGIPPVVGYLSVRPEHDLSSLILFSIVALWQMPHFYAIALLHQEEYAAAGIPVLPVKYGAARTKLHILFFIVAFICAAALPTLIGMTGYLYLAAVSFLGLIWLALALEGFKAQDDRAWAHVMFRYSLVVITLLSTLLVIDLRS